VRSAVSSVGEKLQSSEAQLVKAYEQFQHGDRARAEALCAEILANEPDHAAALELAGIAALLDGRPGEAAPRLERAKALAPSSYNVLSALGACYVQQQNFSAAVEVFNRAYALRPELQASSLNLAGAYRGLGRFDHAIALLRRLSIEDPGDESVLTELGELSMLAGHAAEAIGFYRRALASAPRSVKACRNLAYALKRTGQVAEAVVQYRQLATLVPHDPDASIELGVALAAAGASAEAVAMLRRSLTVKPGDVVAAAALGQLFRDQVPAWHFPMLNDQARNQAYDEAIRRTVRPGSIVLDIGTGSGLLAMMAARAGAAHVYACEAQPLIAEKARDIVRANGFSDVITVIAKPSHQLRIGRDLPRKADVLISEIVDAALIGEGIILTLAHALRHLVDKAAAIVPCAGRVFAMLVESDGLYRQDRVDRAAGFDVSGFNEFSRLSSRTLDLRHFHYRALSPPVEVFRFDFTRPNFAPESKTVTLKATESGLGHALVTWFDLRLDALAVISNDPRADALDWHWMQTIYFADGPRPIVAGEAVSLAASHDLLHIHVNLIS
jgi:Flp pilus assembly protein TadD/precorrin-6B methylase 2